MSSTNITSTDDIQTMSYAELETHLSSQSLVMPTFAPATGAFEERIEDIDIIVCGRADFLAACRLIESPLQLGFMRGSYAHHTANAIAFQRPWV